MRIRSLPSATALYSTPQSQSPTSISGRQAAYPSKVGDLGEDAGTKLDALLESLW